MVRRRFLFHFCLPCDTGLHTNEVVMVRCYTNVCAGGEMLPLWSLTVYNYSLSLTQTVRHCTGNAGQIMFRKMHLYLRCFFITKDAALSNKKVVMKPLKCRCCVVLSVKWFGPTWAHLGWGCLTGRGISRTLPMVWHHGVCLSAKAKS